MKNWANNFILSETMNAFKATFNESEGGVKYLFLDFDDTVRESVMHDDGKGSLRRREFLPEPVRKTATLDDAAGACGEVIKETLNQLGVDFPVYFASDATVFLYNKGKVSRVATFGTEDKQNGKAPKPHPSMGVVAFSQYGKPNLEESYMIGDSYENGDEQFANAIGVQWIHPGTLGTDFIDFTYKKFSEDIGAVEEEAGTVPLPKFYGTHQY